MGQRRSTATVEGKPDLAVDGATFVSEATHESPVLWGASESVLWTPGESLLIWDPTGAGKTTLPQQLALLASASRREMLGSIILQP